jgi:hypothetical protein
MQGSRCVTPSHQPSFVSSACASSSFDPSSNSFYQRHGIANILCARSLIRRIGIDPFPLPPPLFTRSCFCFPETLPSRFVGVRRSSRTTVPAPVPVPAKQHLPKSLLRVSWLFPLSGWLAGSLKHIESLTNNYLSITPYPALTGRRNRDVHGSTNHFRSGHILVIHHTVTPYTDISRLSDPPAPKLLTTPHSSTTVSTAPPLTDDATAP